MYIPEMAAAARPSVGVIMPWAAHVTEKRWGYKRAALPRPRVEEVTLLQGEFHCALPLGFVPRIRFKLILSPHPSSPNAYRTRFSLGTCATRRKTEPSYRKYLLNIQIAQKCQPSI